MTMCPCGAWVCVRVQVDAASADAATDGVSPVPLPPHGTGAVDSKGGGQPSDQAAGKTGQKKPHTDERARRKEYREQAWRDAVSRCELFLGKTPAELEFISQSTQVLKLKAGDTVYTEGDPCAAPTASARDPYLHAPARVLTCPHTSRFSSLSNLSAPAH